MIDDATIKRVAQERGIIVPDDPFTATCLTKEGFNEFTRAIEQLARQEQREEAARICEKEAEFLKSDNDGSYTACRICAEAIRASGKENSNE